MFKKWIDEGLETPDVDYSGLLIINEIMQNPSAVSDSDGEWFEVLNIGDVSLNLNGWTIKMMEVIHM